MTSHPPAGPTGTAPDAARPSAGTTGQPDRPAGQTGRKNPAPDDLPDADAAEPEPHEHLPSRSDDN
ncbi:hypothetical protein [Paraburkholderia sp. JHI869]|uniref:hypothetical protein n=1 Tax=Paraburkholderia sp. JHI869 TaxID=3112959 RepID=UPI003181F2F5